MKKILWLLPLIFWGCPQPKTPGDDADATADSNELDGSSNEACARAGAKLTILGCKEARPDFTAFCLSTLDAGVSINPLCLANLNDCSKVSTCK